MFELMKKSDERKSGNLDRINSRIQTALSQHDSQRRQSSNNFGVGSMVTSLPSDEPKQHKIEHIPNSYTNTNSNANTSSNNTAATSYSAVNTSLSAWEQFEAIRRKDYGVSEDVLMRDLIYVLQGLEGNLIHFNTVEDKYAVTDSLQVARPINSLVEKLGRIGADYRYLQGQISVHRESNGILRQTLCRAIAQELAEYLKLVAFLESSISENKEVGSLSVKMVVFWFHEAGLLMSFLREIFNDSSKLRGGALLSFLEQFRQHGNDQIRQVIGRILDQMLISFGEMLQNWLQDGTLYDPFGEFFISESNKDCHSNSVSDPFTMYGSDFWNQKYVLKLSELPKFIPEALGRRALVAGKTRKFIQAFRKNPPTHLRYLGTDVTMNESSQSNVKPSAAITAENLLDGLEKEMKAAYRLACRQVRHILLDQCQLVDQLRCIKQYVLFSKGDFSMNLLDLLCDGLNKPAGSLFRHNLVGVLEASIRATRDPKESDWILSNLDVRLLSNDQTGSTVSATGWDVFALDYRVTFPIDCVLDPQSMQEYSKLSRYIWGLKRLECVLSRCWQNLRAAQATCSKALKKELRGDLRRMELLQFEMINFVRQALSISFELISGEWETFEQNILQITSTTETEEEKGIDLDELIKAHRNFIINLKYKLKLWSSPGVRSKMAVLSLGILRFESVQNYLISLLTSETTSSSVSSFDHGPKSSMLNECRSNFQSAARHFQADLDDLLMTLQRESVIVSPNPDLGNNCLDIINRLDFNEYHRRRNGFDSRKYL